MGTTDFRGSSSAEESLSGFTWSTPSAGGIALEPVAGTGLPGGMSSAEGASVELVTGASGATCAEFAALQARSVAIGVAPTEMGIGRVMGRYLESRRIVNPSWPTVSLRHSNTKLWLHNKSLPNRSPEWLARTGTSRNSISAPPRETTKRAW